MNKITIEDLITFMQVRIAEELNRPPKEIDPDLEFINFDLDSVMAIHIMGQVEDYVGKELNPLLYWDYPSIRMFSEHILNED